MPAPHTTTDRKALAITAPLRYGGGSANMNSCAINKQCAFRQVSASNPPQRKAANRQRQAKHRHTKLTDSMKKILLTLKYLGLYYVSYTMILFAISKFFGAQFQTVNFVEYIPLGELSDRQLAWSFFGRSYNYNLFLGIIEFIAGSLILFKRTRLAGLLLSFGIYSNIVLIDFEFGVNDAIQHATIEFIIILIWLLPYLSDLKKYFWDMSGNFANKETNRNKIFNNYLPIVLIVSSSAFVIYRHFERTAPLDKIIGSYNIMELSVNNKKIELRQGKYTDQPMLFFESRKVFMLSANDSSYFGDFEIKADSIFISLNKEFITLKSLKAKIRDDEGIIKGITNNGEPFEISIEKARKEK
jgi:hypothetical protein